MSAIAIAAAASALPLTAGAAPRTIDDCESIQAPDAYNQCLALFGPIARGHGAVANAEGSAGAAGADAQPDAAVEPARASSSRGRHGRMAHASRHEGRRHGAGSGSRRHRVASDWHSHGGKKMQFSVVSGHTRLR